MTLSQKIHENLLSDTEPTLMCASSSHNSNGCHGNYTTKCTAT